jgi:hypothetical protein
MKWSFFFEAGAIDLDLAFSTPLRGIHRTIRACEEPGGVVPVVREDGDADAGADTMHTRADANGLLELLQGTTRDIEGGVDFSDRFEDHDELVAAQSGDRIPGANHVLQSSGDGAQNTVSLGMAKSIVDAFEPVEVEEEDRGLFFGPLSACQSVFQARFQKEAVGQARQGIVMGEVRERGLGPKVRDHGHVSA